MRRSRRRCLRRRAGVPRADLVMSPRLRRRDARPPHFRGGGSPSQRGAWCSAARALCMRSLARSLPLWGRPPSRGAHGAAACGAAPALLLVPAQSCRRAHGGLALGRRSPAAAARSVGACPAARPLCVLPFARLLPLWGQSPPHGAQGAAACGAHGAAACGATLALLAPALSCRRACGGVALGRRSSVAAARSLSAVRSARYRAISTRGRLRGHFFYWGGRRRTSLTAPLPAAPRWHFSRRLGRVASLPAA